MEIPKEFLYSKVVRHIDDATVRKRKATSFYNCLSALSEVIEQRGLSDVLHFPKGSKVLTIEDPSFRFYMDLMDIEDVRKRIHLREDEYPYDVAVSFAGSVRGIVEAFVREVQDRGLTVFYDFDQQAQLWGQDLRSRLADVYANEAHYMVVFISEDYPTRDWTDFELAVGKDASNKRTEEYLLPILLDDTHVVGVHKSLGHLDLRHVSISEAADILSSKIVEHRDGP